VDITCEVSRGGLEMGRDLGGAGEVFKI